MSFGDVSVLGFHVSNCFNQQKHAPDRYVCFHVFFSISLFGEWCHSKGEAFKGLLVPA